MINSAEFSKWYLDLIEKTKIADYSPVKGCMIIRPYGFAMWELIQAELDRRIKSAGVQNAYFPLFIPEEFLNKEKKHIDGFSPELAVVTHAGGEKLAKPLVVRPTSETIIYDSFSRWIKSYKDLPLKINQWANVVRWEMRTKPFLRTSEFLWQEGHTAHATEEEALKTTKEHLNLYVNFLKDFLAIPVIDGEKTEAEKFAGAKYTFTMEAMMQDGKALQIGTSHLLAHSFPEAFGVKFQDASGKMQTPWCTSWGMTTRMLGAMLMVHGDEKGFVIPPKVAPVQVAIVPIKNKKMSDSEKQQVDDFVNKIDKEFGVICIRTKIYGDESKTPGSKFFEIEQQGIPLRIEIGLRDVAKNSVMLADRIGLVEGGKVSLSIESLNEQVLLYLNQIQARLYDNAALRLEENLFQADSFQDLKDQLKSQGGGFFKVNSCLQEECEEGLKDIQASMRVVFQKVESGFCFACKQLAKQKVIVAKSY